MADPYTLKQLTEVKDSAPDFGFEEFQEARFAKDDLETEDTGFTYQRLQPNARPPFAHKHDNAEEVYVVMAGSGRAKLDDDIVDLARLDALRVGATVTVPSRPGPRGSSCSPSAHVTTVTARCSRTGGPTDSA